MSVPSGLLARPVPMRLLRHLLLQRLVAVLLVAGTAAPLVPAASAAPVDALASALRDAAALDAGLAAARQAPTRAQAADAFVAAFARAARVPVAPQELYRLLLGASLGDVPPERPDAAFVPAPTAPALPALAGSPAPDVPVAALLDYAVEAPVLDVRAVRAPLRLSGGTRAP